MWMYCVAAAAAAGLDLDIILKGMYAKGDRRQQANRCVIRNI